MNTVMNKQACVYSLTARGFYNKEEMKLQSKIDFIYTKIYEYNQLLDENKVNIDLAEKEHELAKEERDKTKALYEASEKRSDERKVLKEQVVQCIAKCKETNEIKKQYKQERQNLLREIKYNGWTKKAIATIKEQIKLLAKENISTIRTFDWGNYTDIEVEQQKNLNAMFDNDLFRAIGVEYDYAVTEEIVVVPMIIESIYNSCVLNGFMYNDEKYILFASSAGELKNKKSTFIKQSTWERIKNKINCGLTIEKINVKGGINTNKFMAYQSLAKSASYRYDNFNIREAIVVDDIEFTLNREVNYIRHQTLEEQTKKDYSHKNEWDKITTKIMDVEYNLTDGLGLTTVKCFKNSIVRLPWIKGLLTYNNFSQWLKTHTYEGKIKDIWGKEYSLRDIEKGKIKYIFFKSMFKMYKYYDSWDEYCDNFEKYGCSMNIAQEEPTVLDKTVTLNYQMLQQLNLEATEEEVYELSKLNREMLEKIGTDWHTQLDVLGAKETSKSYLNRAIAYYPALLKEDFVKERITEAKKSLIKETKAGRIKVDGVFAYVVPDIVFINQWLFEHRRDIENMGYIEENEIIQKSFKDSDEVDVLRSPSLGFEHVLATVKTPDKDNKKWFNTNAVYTSAKSLISKVLFFDNDGDRLFVIKNDTINNIVKRTIDNYNIKPLYFEMEKANAEIITNQALLQGMKDAFKVCIGEYSNPISKLWNLISTLKTKEEKAKVLEYINLAVMINNFAIDSSKCRFMPELTDEIQTMIDTYKSKEEQLPHFFMYAKDKKEANVLPIGKGVVDQLSDKRNTPNKAIRYAKNGFTAEFNYEDVCDIELALEYINDENVDNLLKELYVITRNKKWKYKDVMTKTNDEKEGAVRRSLLIQHMIRKDLVLAFTDEYNKENAKKTAMVLMYLAYNKRGNKSVSKKILWDSFAEEYYEVLTDKYKGTQLHAVSGVRFSNQKKVD